MANRVETLERLSTVLAAQQPSTVGQSEMTAKVSVGHRGMDWPKPVHHSDRANYSTPSLLLTVSEACEALRISRAQFYILANKQQVIETVHIGKLCRIPRASLQAYVEGLRSTVASSPALDGGLEL
jgi:excisionase family DNA binding protein